jgi:hypothetical protein
MKTLTATLLLISGITAPLLAAPTQIKLDIRYENVDAKWFPDSVSTKSKALPGKQVKVVSAPSVMVKAGQSATVEVIQEYHAGPKRPMVPCGIIIDLTADLDDGGINISGKSIFRRPTDKRAEGVASRFEAQEVLIDLKLEDGIPKVVDLDNGGKMCVTATIIDATGQPLKK